MNKPLNELLKERNERAAEAYCVETEFQFEYAKDWSEVKDIYLQGANDSAAIILDLAAALENYSEMKVGSTVTPKWANDALANLREGLK